MMKHNLYSYNTLNQIYNENIHNIKQNSKIIADIIVQKYPNINHYSLYCGSGKNGMQGMFIAKELLTKHKKVNIIYINTQKIQEKKIIDKIHAITTSKNNINIADIKNIEYITQNDASEIIIDAIIGMGLSAKSYIKHEMNNIIDSINRARKHVICIDMPSGMQATSQSQYQNNKIISGQLTFTLLAHKYAFYTQENFNKTGQIILINATQSEHTAFATMITNAHVNKKIGIHAQTHIQASEISDTINHIKTSNAMYCHKIYTNNSHHIQAIQTHFPELRYCTNSNNQNVHITKNISAIKEIFKVHGSFLNHNVKNMIFSGDAIDVLINNALISNIKPNSVLIMTSNQVSALIKSNNTDPFTLTHEIRKLTLTYNIHIISPGAGMIYTDRNGDIYVIPMDHHPFYTLQEKSQCVILGAIICVLLSEYKIENAIIKGSNIMLIAQSKTIQQNHENAASPEQIINNIQDALIYSQQSKNEKKK